MVSDKLAGLIAYLSPAHPSRACLGMDKGDVDLFRSRLLDAYQQLLLMEAIPLHPDIMRALSVEAAPAATGNVIAIADFQAGRRSMSSGCAS
ncbi:hypothetical protein [Zavarzinia compransoris]|uniref:Uncharacterized protein n=1 Tax=Zavarzinia compransoris TaxID=1264899 RepID=A0A317E9I0_9PROT|nr:hypothetical protein [Zavarzinia compransoris]PWR23381.1 hypothetical protein DKG75_02085 [Zavarzinia compransoris]TDP46046.1 hypothetical protein DES42_104127 [Zavarzinia compransoris]